MTPTIKKRKYSRAGCDECKRRKMKCDEAKPFCYNCTRLHKACVYRVRANSAAPNGPSLTSQSNFGPQFKLYSPKTKKEDKGKSDKINTGVPGPDVARTSEDSGPIADTALDAEMTLSQGDLQSIFNDAWSLVNSITDLPLELDKAAVEVGSIIAFEGNGGEDNGGKGTGGRNGNGNVSSMTESTQTDAVNAPSQSSQPFQPSPSLNPSPNTLFDSFTSFPNVTVSPVQSTSITDLIDHIIAHHSLATPHSTYLQALNETVVSKSFFPFASSSADNVVTNLLLQYANQCPYLLSALLAMIATVQFNVSGDVYHELCGQKYVSVCLKSLSRAFATTDSTSRTSHIERLLLTVMLLTSIFSSKTYENVVSSWKTHLRGAKDLLMRYSGSGTNISAGLALAKTWFFAIDSLAVITTKSGGTVKESAIFKETGYFNRGAYHDALQELGLVLDLPSGCKYNLFLGFSMEFVLFLEHFSKCLDTLRAGADITYRDVTHMMSLVNQVQFTEILPRVDYHTYVVSETSPAHPRSGSMSLPASAYGIVTSSPFHPTASNASPDSFHESISTSVSPSISPGSSNANSIGNSVVNSVNSIATNSTTFSNTIVYSWYDISQQCRCNAIYLRFLLSDGLLPTTNKHLIQQLVDNIMNCLFFVLPKTQNYYDSRRELVIAETEHYFISSDLFDTRCYMIQSAFRVVTGLVVEEDSLERLELFFKGLIKLGNGSAMEALQRVADRRQMVREGHIEMKVNWAEVVPFN